MYIIIAIIVIVGIMLIGIYNRLVNLKNSIENAVADMDVQMKMRFDLVENLVNTVKWYATHEKDTLEKLTQARTQFLNAQSLADKAEADNMVAGTLKTLFSVAESYPDLKANTNFLSLQTELSNIENQIAGSRRYYNATIKEYNTAIMVFPNNVLAKSLGFTSENSYFTITDDTQKEAPKVQF